jgi:hypothetical protein
VQGVVAGLKPPPWQIPDVPLQVPGRSHAPVAGLQTVVAGWKPSTQLPAPSQESVPSQEPPFDVPTQAVVEGWNPSAGHAPDEPVQLSPTSHAPVAGRHAVVAVRKPSTQLPAPSQESVPSQAPLFEVPTQAVVEGWNPLAGHAPELPVQLSERSHWPAD